MTLFVSNTPVTWRSRHGTGRVQKVIAQLEELYYSKTPVTIVTTDKTYRSMGLIGLTLSKSYDTGFDREIPVSFQEIRVTQAQTTTMPEVIAENAGEVAGSGGKGGTTGANAGTANTKISDTPRPANSPGEPQAVEGSSAGGSSASGSTLLHNLAGAAGLWGD